jgi:hypothetical protein
MTKNPSYLAAAIPYLMIRGAADAIDFYKKAFGAEETMRFPAPEGKIGHAEISIEGAPVFLADESPQAGMQSPQQLGGTSVTVCIYVKDVDAFAKQASPPAPGCYDQWPTSSTANERSTFATRSVTCGTSARSGRRSRSRR